MEVSCTREEALEMYKKMQAIRRLETTAGNLYKEKQIRGFCHLYSGQVWFFPFYALCCCILSNFKLFKGSRMRGHESGSRSK